MSGALEVRPVESRSDESVFIELPYRLYAHEPHWVPPLRIAERERWRPADNASLRSRWHRRFLAWRGSRAVGRVAAVRDLALASRWCPGAGLMGFFECEDDSDAAAALLGAVDEALRENGAMSVLGPVNLTTHDEVGLLVEGFDECQTVLTPYNLPYYPSLLARADYRPLRDYHAYEWTPASRESPAIARLARSLAVRRDAIHIRPIDPRHWDDEVRTLFDLYNASFADVWGFVPIGWEEFSERARQFRSFYRPELVLVAEMEGRPVAFTLMLPDVNEALPVARGRLLPLGWWRLKRALPRIRTGRLMLLGLRPDVGGRGLAPLLAAALGEAVRPLGITRVEASLVLDSNARMRRVIEAFGCRCSRTFRLFSKALDR